MAGPASPREPGSPRRGNAARGQAGRGQAGRGQAGRGQAGRGQAGRPRGAEDRRGAGRRLNAGLRLGVTVDLDQVVEQSRHFRVVEVDAGLEPLATRLVTSWIEGTADGAVVDVRAHRLLTQHPVPIESLWPEVRDLLTPAQRSRPRVYVDDIPGKALDAALDRFVALVRPLHDAGKLGTAVFPFASYFVPGPRALDYLAWLRGRSGDLPIAVELRNRQWLDSRHRDETLQFLEEHRLAYVCVDAPPGFDSSLPPLAVVTAAPAMVRFHGRDADAWERGADTGDDHFPSGYRRSDLEPWRARVDKLVASGRGVHVVFTTGTAESAARDARLFLRVLTEDPQPAPAPAPSPRGRRPGRPR